MPLPNQQHQGDGGQAAESSGVLRIGKHLAKSPRE